jgi:hypothetical protein
MTRRLIALVGALAAILVVATPASASAGTISVTAHFTFNPLFSAPIPCGPFAGLNVINEDNGNGVMHFSQNINGFWATGTYEGDLQIIPALSVTIPDPMTGVVTDYKVDPSRPTASGHVADWFGISANPRVAVQHNAVNAQVVTSFGQSVNFHAIDLMQIVPPFVMPFTVKHQFSKFSCF